MKADEEPHYRGHRTRLRERFAEVGEQAMPDYELLELVLFRSIPQRDVKPLAKSMIARFGSFAEVIGAPRERLIEIDGVGEATALDLKLIEGAARRLARGAIGQRAVLASWKDVIEYCRTAMAFSEREQFRILFLDKRNFLNRRRSAKQWHGRSYARLPARSGQARAGAFSFGFDPRAQSPLGRSHTVERRHSHDQRSAKHRQAIGDCSARSYYCRAQRTCELSRVEAD